MAKEILIKQYVTMVRTLAVHVEDDGDNDIEFAAEVADGLPLQAEKVPTDIARVVSDWDYIEDSDDFEDEDGVPISI